jgi:hypothetical protein
MKITVEPTNDGRYGAKLIDPGMGSGYMVEIDVEKILKTVRKQGGAEKRWDINRVEGELREGTIGELIDSDGATIEVKTDFKSSETGNIAVETACSLKPSGINATEAKWWAYVLEGEYYNGEVVVFIKPNRLRRLIKYAREVKGGDANRAIMKLLPVKTLLGRLVGKSD